MAIDWANESYVRLFKRETDDDLLLSWEARAVWYEFLKKCDRSGLLETRRGVRGLAALVRIPHEIVERVIPELLVDGRIQQTQQGYIAPNYLDANDTPRSDRARQADSRLRRKTDAMRGDDQEVIRYPNGVPSHDVTSSHAASQPVTLIRSDTDQISHRSDARERASDGFSRKIPSDWTPRLQEIELAVALGLNVDDEVPEFVAYWLGDGRAKADWNKMFVNRLHSQAKRLRQRPGAPLEAPRRIPDL